MKICVVSSHRSEYGLLQPLLRRIDKDPEFQLQLVIGGRNLIDLDRQVEFKITATADFLGSSDSKQDVAKSFGVAASAFAEIYGTIQPEIVVLLGDRYETLAAAVTACIMRIPIVHIQGGEETQGSIDESFRHSITKMADLHFVAAQPFRRRVMQLGENPECIYVVGALGLDDLPNVKQSSSNKKFLILYHPETRIDGPPEKPLQAIIDSLENFSLSKIFIGPNPDVGNSVIRGFIKDYCKCTTNARYIENLSRKDYLVLLAQSEVLIGNSSSGIIEAPALKTPSINIGVRQEGRPKAKSVITCHPYTEAITDSIRLAISDDFHKIMADTESLYGSPGASSRIMHHLKTIHIHALSKERKGFYDINNICDR